MRKSGWIAIVSVRPFVLWAVVFMLTCLMACKVNETGAVQPPAKRQVFAKKVTSISVKEKIVVSGILEADKTVPISFLVSGKVDRVYVDEGDHVKKGRILAKVEINDYRSNLEIAEAQLFEARDAHDRLLPLYKDGAIAEKAFIKIKAGLDQAKASRDIAKKKVRDTKLLSPISGIIGVKNVELGQTVSNGIPVFTIVKTDRIYARVSVPESEIGKVALGQKAFVVIKALDERVVEGKVTLIGVMAEPRTRSYKVKIELLNPDYVLRAGMIARAQIITDKTITMLTVPGKVIVRDADNLTYVFLVDQEKKTAFRQRVFPGSVFRNEIEIKEGLNAEDVVIVAGQHKITDGSPITVMELTDKDGSTAVTKQKN
ncbi:efflux RND transporter periplasmic adaptor subunit [Desulfobacula phenolica]|uniref:RND family efflux transporter, MFP subunit n=1 Tax=Desulfobacula phenolica TaxID=90732 RepID=A0A1H2IFX2_9BACT|nr:efflux RND transporter periplasmic adaptor subunit [Desulfobacula phenolica]SDU42768.1 RND family efflux transporter, MFP subunit [Desulfobacula phenolica]